MMKTSIIQFLSTMGTATPLHHPTGIFETKGTNNYFWSGFKTVTRLKIFLISFPI